jgi:hypothetical protein
MDEAPAADPLCTTTASASLSVSFPVPSVSPLTTAAVSQDRVGSLPSSKPTPSGSFSSSASPAQLAQPRSPATSPHLSPFARPMSWATAVVSPQPITPVVSQAITLPDDEDGPSEGYVERLADDMDDEDSIQPLSLPHVGASLFSADDNIIILEAMLEQHTLSNIESKLKLVKTAYAELLQQCQQDASFTKQPLNWKKLRDHVVHTLKVFKKNAHPTSGRNPRIKFRKDEERLLLQLTSESKSERVQGQERREVQIANWSARKKKSKEDPFTSFLQKAADAFKPPASAPTADSQLQSQLTSLSTQLQEQAVLLKTVMEQRLQLSETDYLRKRELLQLELEVLKARAASFS